MKGDYGGLQGMQNNMGSRGPGMSFNSGIQGAMGTMPGQNMGLGGLFGGQMNNAPGGLQGVMDPNKFNPQSNFGNFDNERRLFSQPSGGSNPMGRLMF